jgi:hypothetical protein
MSTSWIQHHLIYLCFVLMAIGVLLPYNAIIAATDYFKLIFPTQRVEFDFLASYMIPNVIGSFKTAKNYFFRSRIFLTRSSDVQRNYWV